MSWIRDTDKIERDSFFNSVSTNNNLNSNTNMPWGAIAAAGAGLLGSIFGSSSQSAINREQLKFAREQMENNNRQAEITRAWQEQMQHEQNIYNLQAWRATFDAENAYNSPVQQMKRLMAAGINPFVAASDIAKVDSTNKMAAPQSSTAPSGATGSYSGLPSLQPANPLASVFGNIAQLSQAFKTLRDAEKAGMETTEIKSTLQSTIKKAAADARFADVQAYIQETFGEKLSKKQLAQMTADIAQKWSSAWMNEQNSDKIQKESFEILQRYLKTKVETKILEDSADYIVGTRKAEMEHEQEAIKTEKTKQFANVASGKASLASAVESYSRAQTENEKRQFVVREAHALARMSEEEWKQFAQQAQENHGIKIAQLAYLRACALQAQKADSMEEFNAACNAISTIFDAASKTLGRKK